MPETILITIDGRDIHVSACTSVAAAIALAGSSVTRQSVKGMPRGPFCGMGVCHECRVTIDGRHHRLACQTLCAQDMQVRTGPVTWLEQKA
ncbi:MAG: (2Fe-2S)-binding protein [Pseudomonadota bacterium]